MLDSKWDQRTLSTIRDEAEDSQLTVISWWSTQRFALLLSPHFDDSGHCNYPEDNDDGCHVGLRRRGVCGGVDVLYGALGY